MRPTGRLHLGHLFGALANWKALQEEYDCFFLVADWHALTTDYANPGAIRENRTEMVIDWISAGIDPEKAAIFVQSEILEHAELHLLLSMITPVPWLERNPTYKEQQQELTTKDLSTYGFLGYPVLQAADILIYRASVVPVGVDQAPHVELTREIARRFNHLYGAGVLTEPAVKLTEFPKVPGTDNRKMSKSYGNAIFLADTPEEISAKVRPMMTDPRRKRRTDPGIPEECPAFSYHRLFSDPSTIAEVAEGCRTAGIGCLDCKKPLIEAIASGLAPIRERRAEITRDPGTIREILRAGDDKARAAAEETMADVRRAMGL
jgi:tryptophanyl-tRNA synthetase